MILVDTDASVHDVPRSGLQWDDQRRVAYLVDRGSTYPLARCRVGHCRRWPRTRCPVWYYGGSQGVHGRKSGNRPSYVLHRSVLVPPSRPIATLQSYPLSSDPPHFPFLTLCSHCWCFWCSDKRCNYDPIRWCVLSFFITLRAWGPN